MTSESRPDYASANKIYFNDLTYDDPRIIKLAKRSVLEQFFYVYIYVQVSIYLLDQHRPYENIILSMKIQHWSWTLLVVQVRILESTYIFVSFWDLTSGLISKELAPYAKSIVGVDISQGVVDRYNLSVSNQGIPPEEMRAVCAELKGGDEELDGLKFDVITVCETGKLK